ncbi:DMT family transporter [Candidatus Roizmanbacteria bacterium]|nr:DMT family transporter [Candidatus Roizmanbacteria bacterium]
MNRALIALLFSTVLYGLLGIYSRFIGIDFGIFFQSWTRNFIITLLIVPFFLFNFWKQIRRKDAQWFVLRSLGDLVTMVSIFVVFNKIAIGTSYFLFYAGSTVGGYLIGHYFFKEKITKQKLTSLIIGIFGLVLIYSLSLQKDKLFFYLLANLAGLSSAVWNIFSKKVSKDYSVAQIVFIDSFMTGLLGLALSILFHEKFIPFMLNSQWIANILFAVNSLVTSFLVVYGFRYVEANYGSLILLLEVIFGIFFAFIFFKEIPSLYALIGGSLILTAVIIPKLKWPTS